MGERSGFDEEGEFAKIVWRGREDGRAGGFEAG